ncbi:KUP/HAK/KT family potassium transporter [Caulobacter segnis]
MPLWRDRLFIYLMKNAANPTDFFKIPPGRVVELGRPSHGLKAEFRPWKRSCACRRRSVDRRSGHHRRRRPGAWKRIPKGMAVPSCMGLRRQADLARAQGPGPAGHPGSVDHRAAVVHPHPGDLHRRSDAGDDHLPGPRHPRLQPGAFAAFPPAVRHQDVAGREGHL